MAASTSFEFAVDTEGGLLRPARQCASPNHDERPAGSRVSLVVLHGISLPPGEFGGDQIERFFCNTLDCDAHAYFDEIRDLRVSAHLLVRRGGEVLQFVPLTRRAWHAGQSCFRGVPACNDYSIGVELEGDDLTPYTGTQYRALAALLRALLAAYPSLSLRRVAGHCDIAPGRKTDPGPVFDWLRLYDQVGVTATS